jgi:hypothetical protein
MLAICNGTAILIRSELVKAGVELNKTMVKLQFVKILRLSWQVIY